MAPTLLLGVPQKKGRNSAASETIGKVASGIERRFLTAVNGASDRCAPKDRACLPRPDFITF